MWPLVTIGVPLILTVHCLSDRSPKNRNSCFFTHYLFTHPQNVKTKKQIFRLFNDLLSFQWWVNDANIFGWAISLRPQTHICILNYISAVKEQKITFSKKTKEKRAPTYHKTKKEAGVWDGGTSMSNVPSSPLKHDWRVGGLELSIAWTHLRSFLFFSFINIPSGANWV